MKLLIIYVIIYVRGSNYQPISSPCLENFSEHVCSQIVWLDYIIFTVLASTTVVLYFLHYTHLDSSEVVQLVQFKFKIL